MLPDEESQPGPFLQRIWKTYKVPLILGTISLLAILFSAALLVKSTITSEPVTFSSESASPSAEAKGSIAVDIEGAVNKPGVYNLIKGARVEEALRAAGGFSEEADVETIAKTLNRAAILSDGAKIFIPKAGGSFNVVNNIVRRESQPTVLGENFVNVNTASETELDFLPGVGPATAAKIISGRPYQTLEELVTKKAVGQSLFLKIKDRLTL